MHSSILNIPITAASRQEVSKMLERMAQAGQHRIVTINPEFLMEAQAHPTFRKVLETADLAVADGIGIRYAARALGQPVPPRITGVDLVEELSALAARKHYRVFLLGGRKGIAQRAAVKLIAKYPGLQIVGVEQGERHWWRLSDADLRGKINRTHANMLFVAYGAPKQDLWIAQNLSKLHSVRIAVGVGGTFDFLSGEVKRAPELFRSIGLEWLWRLAVQPWRRQRILTATWRFWQEVQKHKRARKNQT